MFPALIHVPLPPHLHPHLSHPAQSGFPSTCSSVRWWSSPKQCRSQQLGSWFHRTSNTSRAGYNTGRPCKHRQQIQVAWWYSPWLLLPSLAGLAAHCQLHGGLQETCRNTPHWCQHRQCMCAPTVYYLKAGKIEMSVIRSDSIRRICKWSKSTIHSSRLTLHSQPTLSCSRSPNALRERTSSELNEMSTSCS